MTKKTKLTKAEKKVIMDKHGSTTAAELFSDKEWAKLMFAGHSEVKDVMQNIADDSNKK